MKIANETYFALVEEQLAAGGRVKINLIGTSMRPTLIDGDELTLESAGEVAVGDVVLFRYMGRHILHRIVAIEGDRYIMRGDNCISNEIVGREDIVAKLVAVKKHNKLKHWVVRWLGHKGRRKLRPWYFVALAFLMWAPLNGVGIPLDNYLLGLRMDHLLHASVFIPCALFWRDLFRRGRNLYGWLVAVATGLLTEGVQYLLPYRGFDVNDLIANFLGVSLGALLLWVYRKFSSR